MKTIYRAYRDSDSTTFYGPVHPENPDYIRGKSCVDAQLLWEIVADTAEEAAAIYHLRMGFEPYFPIGQWQPCPKCGAVYYPEGSGECWHCGPIC